MLGLRDGEGGGMGVTVKEVEAGNLCGDKIVSYLACGWGYMNLHLWLNGLELYTYIHTNECM